MLSDIKAILFDLDGTLIDSAPDLGAAADRLRTDQGLEPLGLPLYRPHTGTGARGMLKIAFEMEPDHPDFEQLKEAFFRQYEQNLVVHTAPFEGVNELIEGLVSRDLGWGIVTNKSERFTLPLVKQIPLLTQAQIVICGDTTPHAKPHPAPILEAIKRMGLRPAECVYVGDDERDIVAGKAAGVKTVAAGYGYLGHAGDIQTWGADININSPLDLLNWLPKI
jgi:phosphoglycolate phosphatase